MPVGKNKFLVDLLHGLSHKQVFFLLWAGIVGIFVLLMYAHYRRYTRRNFRGPGEAAPPLTRIGNRSLYGGDAAKQVVPKDNTPTRGQGGA